MARPKNDAAMEAVEQAIVAQGSPLTASEVNNLLAKSLPPRTLQRHLSDLVQVGRLSKEGSGRWTKYRPGTQSAADTPEPGVTLSAEGNDIRRLVRLPQTARRSATTAPSWTATARARRSTCRRANGGALRTSAAGTVMRNSRPAPMPARS